MRSLQSVATSTSTLMFVFCATAAMAVLPSLDGKWMTPCTKAKQQFIRETLAFSGKNVQAVTQSYSDAACTTLQYSGAITGTYQEGADSTFAKSATEIDTTLGNVSLIFQQADLIELVNKVELCGYSNWAAGQAKDVTGKKCGHTDMPKSGDRVYDIYKTTSSTTLLSGRATRQFDGSTPDKRPREINTKKVFTKQ